MSERTVQDLLSLKARTALLTGATGHLGGAMAAALAEAGASVVVSSRSVEHAKVIANRLPSIDGAKHHGIAIDHFDEASIERGIQSAIGFNGRLDVVVANAHEPLGKDWRTVTGEEFTRQLANSTGYFLLARHFRDHVVARGGQGSLVLLGSMYGVVGSYPDVYENSTASPAAYHALKGGIVHLTRHLAVYWAKDGVRVNCLSPGPFPSDKAPTELVSKLEQRVPMGRLGKPDELKGPLVFLASDASSFMTGQNLLIDGGWTAW